MLGRFGPRPLQRTPTEHSRARSGSPLPSNPAARQRHQHAAATSTTAAPALPARSGTNPRKRQQPTAPEHSVESTDADLQLAVVAPATAPDAGGKWQVLFPQGWWDLPADESYKVHEQLHRGQTTAEYNLCRNKKLDEWHLYRIDFTTMKQTNTVSGRIREVRCNAWDTPAAPACSGTNPRKRQQPTAPEHSVESTDTDLQLQSYT